MMRFGRALAALAAVLLGQQPARAFAASGKCVIATTPGTPVGDACAQGGRAQARRLMKELIKTARDRGRSFSCDGCHKSAEDDDLLPGGRDDFAQLLAIAGVSPGRPAAARPAALASQPPPAPAAAAPKPAAAPRPAARPVAIAKPPVVRPAAARPVAAAIPAQAVRTVEGVSEYALPDGGRVLLVPDPGKTTVSVIAAHAAACGRSEVTTVPADEIDAAIRSAVDRLRGARAGDGDPAELLDRRLRALASLGRDADAAPARRDAVLVIAGKVEAPRALAAAARALAALPRRDGPAPAPARAPAQDGERSATIRLPGDAVLVGVAYHGTSGADAELAAEQAALDVLASRLARRLGAPVSARVPPCLAPCLMTLTARLPATDTRDATVARATATLSSSAEGLAAAHVSEAEVARWRGRAVADLDVAALDGERAAAELAGWAAAGDWRLLFVHRERVKAVTAGDVERVAARYLKPANRTLVTFVPTRDPDQAPVPETPDVVAAVEGSQSDEPPLSVAVTVADLEQKVQRTSLMNGMKLALLPRKARDGRVELALTVHFGSEADLKDRATAAALIAPMLVRGSKRHTREQIDQELARLRARVHVEAEAEPGTARLTASTVRDNVPALTRLLGELLREPAFPVREWESLRKEQLARLEDLRQQPSAVAATRLTQAITAYDKHDVRYTPSLDEAIQRLKAVHLGDVERLYRSLWGGSHAALALVGDFDDGAATRAVDAAFGDWRSPRPWRRIERPFVAGRVVDETIDAPESPTAAVGVALRLELRDDEPGYPAAVLLAHVLDGTASSRLAERLRRKEGICTESSSIVRADAVDRDGAFMASAVCAPADLRRAMDALLEEVRRLAADGVTDKELAAARKRFAAEWNDQIARDAFLAGQLARGLEVDRTLEYFTALDEKLSALTAADLRAAAHRYIQPARLARVRVGDVRKTDEATRSQPRALSAK